MDITIRFGDQVVKQVVSRFAATERTLVFVHDNDPWSGAVINVVPGYIEVTSGLWNAETQIGTRDAGPDSSGLPGHISADSILVTVIDILTNKEITIFPLGDAVFNQGEQVSIRTAEFNALTVINDMHIHYVQQDDGSWQTAVVVYIVGGVTPKH